LLDADCVIADGTSQVRQVGMDSVEGYVEVGGRTGAGGERGKGSEEEVVLAAGQFVERVSGDGECVAGSVKER
jgi:hypothetical protein